MLIDLHTHTQPLSHDSALTPDQLIEAAKAAGLDAVCLTEHDFTWDPEEARELARRHSFTVIPAIEVNTDDGHFIAFGLDRYVYGMHRTAELARLVDEAGGALVAAHPYRRQLPFELRDEGDWTEPLERAVANPASDAHQRSDVGRYATAFQRDIAHVPDLVRELKAGRFQPRLRASRRADLR